MKTLCRNLRGVALNWDAQRPRSFWSAPRIATSGLPLAMSNTGSPRFTDFPSLCACSETSLTNLIGSGLKLLCLRIHSKPECRCTWPEVRFLVLTSGDAASGDENAQYVNMQRDLRARPKKDRPVERVSDIDRE